MAKKVAPIIFASAFLAIAAPGRVSNVDVL
jgi:hypothetical protein